MALTPASILADYSSGIGTQGATLKVDANNERVGIGTTNPQGTLQVGTAITMGSGIITATSFDASTATFSGNVSVGGVLTYEDVTSVDSLGIVTARSGVHIPNGDIGIGTDDTSLGKAVIYAKGSGNGQGPIVSLVRESDTPATGDKLGSINFYGKDSSANTVYYKSVYTRIVDPTSGSATGQLCIGTDTSTAGQQVIIDADGSVGIGTVLTLDGTTGAITGASLTNTQVAAISSEISESDVVDVFVYDTRKDSDGGAWRKRTQHTSWYNETLNTATRGSRKDFPAVAVIVTTSDGSNDSNAQVRIYDGDDPDLPMWMVFQASGGVGPTATRYAIPGVNDLKASMMLNGTLCVAVNDVDSAGRAGLEIINFLSETTEHLSDVANNGNVRSEDSIAKRNTALSVSPTDDSRQIVENASNDVAMTALPNAPIDPSTGLPIPTIALATDSGASIIKDDGTVVDLIQNHAEANKVKHIDFDSETNAILWTTDYVTGGSSIADSYKLNVNPIPSSDYTSGGTVVGNFQDWNRTIQSLSNNTKPHIQGDNITGFISNGGNGSYAVSSNGTNQCLNLLYEFPGSTVGSTDELNAMVAYATTSYNSGWMYRDIKGAFLSDTTVESLTANTNLASSATQTATARLTSETYTDGATSWQMVDDAGNDNGYLALVFGGLTAGQSYHLSMTVDANAALDAGYEHKIEQGADIIYLNHWNGTGAATLTTNFTAISGTNALYFYVNAITVNVTNFNIRAVDDEDRSVNNNGLAVYGTITKSAVAGSGATAADLVGYGGFSSSSYLKQPYNSALAPGTGQYSVSCWFKTGSTSSDQYIFDRSVDGSPRNLLLIRGSSSSPANVLQFFHVDASGNQSDLIASDFTVTDDVWHHVVALCDGSTYRVYVDGSASATTNSTIRDVDNTDTPPLYVGVRYSLVSPITGQLALFRYSLSAPSPEQIKKMYEDEKFLFQENAKATLYGSSDAVTALAFDEDTNLLHVGTSSGRSDFQGLRRINNTTTAVTTAISASNDLVAEE